MQILIKYSYSSLYPFVLRAMSTLLGNHHNHLSTSRTILAFLNWDCMHSLSAQSWQPASVPVTPTTFNTLSVFVHGTVRTTILVYVHTTMDSSTYWPGILRLSPLWILHAMNVGAYISSLLLSIPLGRCSEVELPHHMAIRGLVL